MMVLISNLLGAILLVNIVQCIALISYLRRKKPGPKPRKKKALTAETMSPPKKRFRARTYEERQMK
jgi:hypothetical protein